MRIVQISQVDIYNRESKQKTDLIEEETPLHIFLNRTHYATILCSPNKLEELALGHLISEGVVKSLKEIKEVHLEENGKCAIKLDKNIDVKKRIQSAQPFTRLVTSSCGSPDYWPLSKLVDRLQILKVPSNLHVDVKIISDSVRQLNMIAGTFRKTGGTHISAVYSSKGELETFAEDVGRHNAVDKAVGTLVLKKLDLGNCFLASSGRLSGDIVLKAARMKIQVVSSLAAALYSGIEIAQQTGITLIGFVRGRRMNIYTNPERIILSTID